MIVAGFILLAVGAADLVRQFAPRRWIGYLSVAVILLLLGSVSDAATLPDNSVVSATRCVCTVTTDTSGTPPGGGPPAAFFRPQEASKMIVRYR